MSEWVSFSCHITPYLGIGGKERASETKEHGVGNERSLCSHDLLGGEQITRIEGRLWTTAWVGRRTELQKPRLVDAGKWGSFNKHVINGREKREGFRNHGMDGRKKCESSRNHTQCGQGKIKRFSKDAQYGRDVGKTASSPRVFEKIQSLTETQVANDLSRDNGFSSRDHVTVYRPQSWSWPSYNVGAIICMCGLVMLSYFLKV